MYDSGMGVEQNPEEAVRWYRLAADQGDAAAQLLLGGKYFRGDGVAQDFGQAERWYRMAADQGEPNAQFDLGDMYAEGQGVASDPVEAYAWYTVAASNGKARALDVRDLLAAEMEPAQIDEAEKLAAERASELAAEP